MTPSTLPTITQLFTFRWNPNRDLAVVVLTWFLVVAALSMATFVVGQETWGAWATS